MRRICTMLGAGVCCACLVTGGGSVLSQSWWDESKEAHDYDLSSYSFLILLGEDFDYHETTVIKRFWEDWGAKVDVAGAAAELPGHLWKKTAKGWDRSERKTLKPDLLLPDVDLSRYAAILVPGGGSPENLLEHDAKRVVGLLKEAERSGVVLAAICHGPRLLAAAGLAKDRKVTGHKEVRQALEEAGGVYVTEVCAVDGNIITGNWPYFEALAVKVAERLLYPDSGGPSSQSPFVTNDVLKAIKERRSVRRFQDRAIDDALMRHLLKAATWAPSADNSQPWKFVVVKERPPKEQILEALSIRMGSYFEAHGVPLDYIRAYWARVLAAPVHVFAFCDIGDVELEEEFEDIERRWAMQGVAVACQNILLAASEMELGAVWLGMTLAVEDEIKEILRVPGDVRLVTAIALGYPDEKPLPRIRKPLDDVVFEEVWDKGVRH